MVTTARREATSMTLPIVLSSIGMVVALIIRTLGSFPDLDAGTNSAETNVIVDESYRVETVHRAGEMLSSAYGSIIDELISFQRDPDYERAEAGRQEFVDVGTSLTGMFKDFEKSLQGKFEELTGNSGGGS